MDSFAIASFRSRQQVLQFQSALNRIGIRSSVVSTPREIAIGCGLSLRFEMEHLNSVVEMARSMRLDTLVGFYALERVGNRLTARPISIAM